MISVAILQARTNSSRLPCKVLLPINRTPIVVLAAQRAANTGRDVIVVTSNEPTDDSLSETLKSYGIPYYRGSLNNTLERVVLALTKYTDETFVFRLTADNVFPDGKLLDEIEKDFKDRELEYLCCNGMQSGLPYGMSVELTRLGHLREALKNTNSFYDLEHVTPYIRRKFGESYFEKYKKLNRGLYRCTVDCIDDYCNLQKVFSGVTDSVNILSFDLIDLLINTKYQPLSSSPVNKLVVGTAQIGLSYGITNSSGRPEKRVSEQILKTAILNGVMYLDTARVYGNSEQVLGEVLSTGWQGRAKIITKLSTLSDCPKDSSIDVVNAFVDASFFQSCSSLRVSKLDVLMLHRASHVSDFKGAVWKRLLQYKADKKVELLGVSVQNPEELDTILSLKDVSIIQMPFNILDWRWKNVIPKIIKEKKKRNLIIHVRSALLQGLLISGSKNHWHRANVEEPESIINWLQEQASSDQKKAMAAYCLNYVKSLEWVDGVVVGMEMIEQLNENIKTFSTTAFMHTFQPESPVRPPFVSIKTLDPSCWRK
jgi:spore coat polysaccharide biosynthesis protein SpsF (cytidylyltransferase family)/aryl-alcohol dehydrogenase-like predicted oxidoreductase